ncbi:hypothetical protein LLG46_07100 [bacterium]|nr:hypothetical protein [bacterium]
MLRAFWTWDPVSCIKYNAYCEPAAYQDNKWFFDKSVWQRMLRTMAECGFDSLILANTHPFPFMIDLSAQYPESAVIDETGLSRYQNMHHWIFENALDYDIAPHLFFSPGCLPDSFTSMHKLEPDTKQLPDVATEYTHMCVRTLLENYPELSGLFVSVDRADAGFVQQTVVDAIDAIRPDAPLYVCVDQAAPDAILDKISRRADRPIRYSVKYTADHLVDADPDTSFVRWIEAAGSENTIAEFHMSNFEPWTSFSFDTVEGVLSNLNQIGCGGLSVMPLSVSDWPRTSDAYFKYQFQRDFVWYSVWAGSSVSQLLREGQPKWLLRNKRIIDGFQAGSRILELLSLYIAGDKTDAWRPQFCCMFDHDTNKPHLLSIEDILHIDDDPAFSGRRWWTEVTGDKVVHPAEYVGSGTPENAYGPDELIEELADLSEQAVASGEKGMRNNSGEKELPGLTRDAFCMGRLGEFYVERLKAALAHARGEDKESLEHMARALGLYREIRGVDSFHRGDIMIVVGRECVQMSWTSVTKALEAEYADASHGDYRSGNNYPIG